MQSKVTAGILAVLLASACVEPAADTTLPAARIAPPLGSKAGSVVEFNVLVRKHGRGKRYRGTLDPQQRTLQLRSITDPACYDDDPTCNGEPNTPECSLTDEACRYGHYDVSGTDSVHLENPPELSEGWYDAGPYICPAYVDDPEFVYKGRLFQLEDVRIFRVGFLPMTSGIPKAR
jgi:hypothetical protein